MLIAYHYIVLRDDGSAARVACPGNLAALKPPLLKPNSEPHHILPRTEQVVVYYIIAILAVPVPVLRTL